MKQTLLVLICCFFPFFAQSAEIEKIFTSMPDSMIPQLEEPWRKDLIALHKSGKEARLQNLMNGYSKLEEMTDDFIAIQVTERSRIEIKLLPLINNTHIVCLIRTAYGPVPDSQLSFYTTDWEPIANNGMFTPTSPEWFYKEKIDKNDPTFQFIQARLDMCLFKYSLSGDSNTLTVEYTTPLYLNKEEQQKAAAFLKDTPRTYVWKASRFE